MGVMGVPVYALLIGLCMPVLLGAQNDSCQHFKEVPENEYDRTYSSIHETDKRPLGFVRETLPYNSDAKNPCYMLENIEGRQVEIMFETIPSTMLCFRDLGNRTQCYDGRHQECKYSAGNKANIVFYCDKASGCSESAVNFWLRITIGPEPQEDPEGLWCMNRGNEMPEELAPLPSDFEVATVPAPSEGSILSMNFLFTVVPSTIVCTWY